jgi:hypothetical protein
MPVMTVADKLEQMRELTARLSEGFALEESGVRDGDGFWHGCDPIDGTIFELARVWNGGVVTAVTSERVADDDIPF